MDKSTDLTIAIKCQVAKLRAHNNVVADREVLTKTLGFMVRISARVQMNNMKIVLMRKKRLFTLMMSKSQMTRLTSTITQLKQIKVEERDKKLMDILIELIKISNKTVLNAIIVTEHVSIIFLIWIL